MDLPVTDISKLSELPDVDISDVSFVEEALRQALPGIMGFLYNLAIAALIAFIGIRIIGMIKKWSRRTFLRMKVEESVSRFLSSCISVGLYGVLLFIVAGMLGVNSASIVALLGSAGIAISLALQGSLSNFAGGVLILLSRPFTVGDYIINKDGEGTVTNIGIIYTTLLTTDNRKIVLPNGALSNSPLTNVTAQDRRRVVINVGISYEADLKKAKELLQGLFEARPEILPEDGIEVYLDSLGESSVNLTARAYTRTEDYWNVKWALTEEVKLCFDREGIEIPYNKLDVNLKQGEKEKKEA